MENSKEMAMEIIAKTDVVQSLVKGEVDMQVATARQYPRSLEQFRRDALTLATQDQEIAGSCFYVIPRAGKIIEGPSVRLAEIVACCWGNLRVETRVLGADDTHAIAQATCWDMEKNVMIRTETRRSILTKEGKRFGGDMVTVTGNAAASIALRNAIFRVVPFTYVKSVYEETKQVAVGKGRTLDETRDRMITFFAKVGIVAERVLLNLDRKALSEITLDDCIKLRGIATAIQDGEVQANEAFPNLPVGTLGFGKRSGEHTPPEPEPAQPNRDPDTRGELTKEETQATVDQARAAAQQPAPAATKPAPATQESATQEAQGQEELSW